MIWINSPHDWWQQILDSSLKYLGKMLFFLPLICFPSSLISIKRAHVFVTDRILDLLQIHKPFSYGDHPHLHGSSAKGNCIPLTWWHQIIAHQEGSFAPCSYEYNVCLQDTLLSHSNVNAALQKIFRRYSLNKSAQVLKQHKGSLSCELICSNVYIQSSLWTLCTGVSQI